MVCNDCPREVRSAVLTVEGIKNVRIDLESGIAKIVIENQNVKPEDIINDLRDGDSHSEFDAKEFKDNKK